MGQTGDAQPSTGDRRIDSLRPGLHEGVLRPAKRILGRPGKLAEKGCTCEIVPVALRLVDAVARWC